MGKRTRATLLEILLPISGKPPNIPCQLAKPQNRFLMK